MPAVANAVYDAIGVRIDELPITPDKVLAALEKKAKGETPRIGRRAFPMCPTRAHARAAALGRRRRQFRQHAATQTREEGAWHMRLPWFEFSFAEVHRRSGEDPRRRGPQAM